MIQGIGCDIVQISRFDKGQEYLEHFMDKYFTSEEIKEIKIRCSNKDDRYMAQKIATRFAGKEAVAKSLGCGFRFGIRLKDIEIVHDSLGCPKVFLYNNALKKVMELVKGEKYNIYISLSNEKDYVNAMAILEK